MRAILVARSTIRGLRIAHLSLNEQTRRSLTQNMTTKPMARTHVHAIGR
ncbi:MAG: hypothetical protein K2H18_04175 [Muribaculaceae bacterium]|nr:hypothetical protein [Muribaculaceae bacterium]